MTKTNHPIEQEELMAYLDGELATDRAVTAAAHLKHCQECQRLAADLKGVSQKLMEWVLEMSESEVSPKNTAALEEREKQHEKTVVSNRLDWRVIFRRRRVWAGGFAVAILVLGMFLVFLRNEEAAREAAFLAQSKKEVNHHSYYAPPPPPVSDRNSGIVASDGYVTNGILSSPNPQATPPPLSSEGLVGTLDQNGAQAVDAIEDGDLTPSKGPLIVRTASLTVTVREFDKARVALDEILKRHHGYMGELNVIAPSEAGRTLTATLRVPADQLDATLTELKTLGRIDGESQGGEEVTQQYVDLQARLANAKHTEQRLTDILRQRTGKLADVLAVEMQIGRVRGEIERMQAEKKELTKQMQFATLNATVKEDYKAPMQMAPPSTSSRFHNAAVDGYRSVVEGLVDVLLFLLSTGPSLLIWAAILFFPVRWAWRKLRKNLLKDDVPAAS